MAEPAHRVVTYQDVLDAPPGFTAEILNGSLWLTPRPGVPHQAISTEVSADLAIRSRRRRGGDDPSGGWVILTEVELHLGGEPDPTTIVVVPDLSGWRRERMPRRPDTPAITLRPDWVCEILSPGARNARRDRLVKVPLYHELGVPWLWIVDPLARTVEVFRNEPEGYLQVGIFGGRGEARLPPFDEEPFDLGNWWPEHGEDEDEDAPTR